LDLRIPGSDKLGLVAGRLASLFVGLVFPLTFPAFRLLLFSRLAFVFEAAQCLADRRRGDASLLLGRVVESGSSLFFKRNIGIVLELFVSERKKETATRSPTSMPFRLVLWRILSADMLNMV
jgi:hypothetical protein